MGKVEEVARAIDPSAFRQFESMRDYCLRTGDTADEAARTADWAHGSQIDEAMVKARAAIAAMREPSEKMERAARFWSPSLRETYSEMIDAALSEEQG